MNGTVTHFKTDDSFKIPRISDKLKIADKINKKDENTTICVKHSKITYGDFLQKSSNLELFLNASFNVESNREELISFILNNNLLNIIKILPSSIKTHLNTVDLEIQLETKYRDQKWIVINIFTMLDGNSASNNLDLLEQELTHKFGDEFLNNILFNVEF